MEFFVKKSRKSSFRGQKCPKSIIKNKISKKKKKKLKFFANLPIRVM